MTAPRYRPQRVVCLTAETTEIAFAVGAGDRVVGVTGYAVRPPEARQKPRVAAFQTAHIDRIMRLEPDLVLGFSDLQADLAAELIRRGVNVLVTNQRSLAETYAAIEMVGAVLGEPDRGAELAGELRDSLEQLRPGDAFRRPRVLFEEWDDPLITGIRWVSEIIEICGGGDIYAELGEASSAGDRIVDPADVISREPDVVIASWCGKRVRPERIRARPGWDTVPAVQRGRIHEVKSPDILQPGPSLIHGAREIARLVREAAS